MSATTMPDSTFKLNDSVNSDDLAFVSAVAKSGGAFDAATSAAVSSDSNEVSLLLSSSLSETGSSGVGSSSTSLTSEARSARFLLTGITN